jgi:hypothetical protein
LNLGVCHLPEVDIPLPHREERFRYGHAYEFIRFSLEAAAGLGRANRNGNDQFLGSMLANAPSGSDHRGAGGQAIVHKHQCPTSELRPRRSAAIQLFTAGHFPHLSSDDCFNFLAWNSKFADQLVVQDSGCASNCAHCQLRLPWHAQFANDDYVERRF